MADSFDSWQRSIPSGDTPKADKAAPKPKSRFEEWQGQIPEPPPPPAPPPPGMLSRAATALGSLADASAARVKDAQSAGGNQSSALSDVDWQAVAGPAPAPVPKGRFAGPSGETYPNPTQTAPGQSAFDDPSYTKKSFAERSRIQLDQAAGKAASMGLAAATPDQRREMDIADLGKTADKPRDVLTLASDFGRSIRGGAANLLGSTIQFADPSSEFAASLNQVANDEFASTSDVQRAKERRQELKIGRASSGDIIPQLGEYLSSVAEDPALGLTEIGKQVSSLLALGGVGSLARAGGHGLAWAAEVLSPSYATARAIKGSVGIASRIPTGASIGAKGLTGAAMGGGDAAQQTYERLMDAKQTPEDVLQKNADYQQVVARLIGDGVAPAEARQQARQAIAESRARLSSIVPAIIGAVSGTTGLQAESPAKTIAQRGQRAAAELGGEVAEETSTQVSSNAAIRSVDPSQSITEDVGRTIGQTVVSTGPAAGMTYFHADPAAANLPPTQARAASITRFDELAAAFGLNPKAAQAVRTQAGAMPADDVPGFLDRATTALNKVGMFKKPVDEAGMQALDARLRQDSTTTNQGKKNAGTGLAQTSNGGGGNQRSGSEDALGSGVEPNRFGRTEQNADDQSGPNANFTSGKDRGGQVVSVGPTSGTSSVEPDYTGLDTPTAATAPETPAPIAGTPINRNWTAFSPESGTLNIPREQMPQIDAEHRGALVNFLNARGITHEQDEVPAYTLKPTQAEFSPQKVRRAAEYEGGQRSILVSSDGHVLDGTHQWMAALDDGESVKIIRLNAPIQDLLRLAHQFPSSRTAPGPRRSADVDKPDLHDPDSQPAGSGDEPAPAAVGGGVADGRVASDARGSEPGVAAGPVPGSEQAAPVVAGSERDKALNDLSAGLKELGGVLQPKAVAPAQAPNTQPQGAITPAATAPTNAPETTGTEVQAPEASTGEAQAPTGTAGAAGPAAADTGARPAPVEAGGVKPAPEAGEVYTIDGKPHTVFRVVKKSVTFKTGQGQRAVTYDSETWQKAAKVEQTEPAAPKVYKLRSQAEKARDELGNTHRLRKVQGGYILRPSTDKEQAAAVRNGQRLARPGAPDVDTDSLLTAIAKLGGLHTDEKPDTIGEGNKNVGGKMLFTKGGMRLDEMANGALSELGYIPADQRGDPTNWLRSAIRGEFMGSAKHHSDQGTAWMEERAGQPEAMSDEEVQARRDDYERQQEEALSDFTPDELDEVGYTAGSPAAQALTEQMLRDAEAAGIDTETLRDDVVRATEGLSSDEYHAELQAALTEALTQHGRAGSNNEPQGSRASPEDHSQTAGDQSQEESRGTEAVEAPALDLQAQTPADLKAKADREEAASKAERTKKAAEQERLRKEAEARDLKARADQTVDDFQLGQDADRQMSGMGSLFDEPAPAPTPAQAPTPAPSAIPPNVQSRLKAALQYLQGIRAEVDRVKKAGGAEDVRITWEKYAVQVASAEERVDQIEAKAKELGTDLAPTMKELGGRPSFDDVKTSENAAHPDEEEPTFTEAQARKQIEWRDLGQKNGTKTHAMFFYTRPEDKGTGRAMGYGDVQLFQGSSGWKVDGEGNSIPSLADAKKAAIDAAIPKLRNQGWLKPEQTSPRASGTKIESGDSEEVKKAKADLMAGLGDLAGLLSRPGRANIVPEDEQRLLPILTKVFDAAFRLGYLKFKDAAKFVLDQIRNALGEDAANAISLDHLQGSYIGMAGRYKDQGASTKKEVVSVEDKAEIEAHQPEADNSPQEPGNVPNTPADLERNRQDAGAEDAPVAVDVPSDQSAGSTGAPGGSTSSARSGRPSDPGVPSRRPPAGGEPGDQPVHRGDGTGQPSLFPSRDPDGQRSDDPGIPGVPPETLSTEDVADAAESGMDDAAKRTAQRAADKLPVKPGDLDNIRATLPYLLPGQQEDVHFAEQRLSKPDGYGVLFTNGTGTGKTFLALGIVKRYDRNGKSNTLILVPDGKIMSDWVDSGRALGLTLTPLEDTKDAGRGITITTYANAGDNDSLATRAWDLVVPDEAHGLMQSADGGMTKALQVVRAITLHPDGKWQRFDMLHRPEIERRTSIRKQIDANNKIASHDDTMDAMVDSLRRENAALEAEWKPLNAKLEADKARIFKHVEDGQGAARPRLAALSATPFAYVPTIEWAHGYVFDYGPEPKDRGYNTPSASQQFFMQHFGYRMRYGKLTKPEAAVDSGLLERQFNTWLKKSGSLSGRMLDVHADYDRRFILAESKVGNEIDRAREWIREQAKALDEQHKKEDKETAHNGFSFLLAQLAENFEGPLAHLMRRYLLEAIKAKEVIPHVREHLAMGRKVVVFHDFKQGGSTNPFRFTPKHAPTDGSSDIPAARAAYNSAANAFNKEFPDLAGDQLLADLISPVARFVREFPDVLLINGDQKKSDLLQRYKRFQSDDSGPMVMLVQSDKNKGWSGHDTTGKHQRVLFNLGLPTQPTKTIQTEGRIYRTGQASDAMFRYLNTGTNWERWAFASTIAERAGTAENLGMGEQARALKDGYIAAFEESGDFPAGHEGEGKGGKERDRLANNAISEYDRAKAFYWATEKKNARTKAREGADYFATPEPLGLKMTQWLDLRGGEASLEPSAGHGAIARWLPDNTTRTAIEPSTELGSRLALVFDGKIIRGTFEDLHVVNKFDGVAMNPPFGSAGRTAVDHVAKAATHLNEGGRIVALIPEGSTNEKFDKWFYEESKRPSKPLYTLDRLGPIHEGDTLTASGALNGLKMTVGHVDKHSDGRITVRPKGEAVKSGVSLQYIESVKPGPRTETYKPAEGLHLVAEIRLPSVAFERAGTGVRTRVMVIEKMAKDQSPNFAQRKIDLSDITDIKELFERLENIDLPQRMKPQPAEQAAPEGPKQQAQAAKADSEDAAKAAGLEPFDYVTSKGKTLRVVAAPHLTKDQAAEIEGSAWSGGGRGGPKGYYVKVRNVPMLLEKYPPPSSAQPVLSQSQPFYSALSKAVDAATMNAAPASGWKGMLKNWISTGKAKADEVAWTGLADWLDLQQGKVTKQAVSDYLKANGVQVTETVLGEPKSAAAALTPQLKPFGYGADVDMDGELYYFKLDDEDGNYAAYEDMPAGAREVVDAAATGGISGNSKYGQYQLPGGTNYREVLLTLPERGAAKVDTDGQIAFNPDQYATQNYRSGHWEKPNVLAHIRVNDRTDADGKRVLFVEELQSDYAQDGRKKGFREPFGGKAPKITAENLTVAQLIEREGAQGQDWVDGRNEMRADLGEPPLKPDAMLQSVFEDGKRVRLTDRIRGTPEQAASDLRARWEAQLRTEAGQHAVKNIDKLPAAPFVDKTDAWVSLALKRVIKMALDEGYDKVAFVNGAQSAERYSLSKEVREVSWRMRRGDKNATVSLKNGDDLTFRLDANGVVQSVEGTGEQTFIGKSFDEVVGKDLAAKIMTDENGVLAGNGLDIGGTGMKAFYDKIVPAVAKDVLKKLGGGQMQAIDIAGRDQAEGQYSIRQEADGRWQIMEGERETQSPASWFADRAEAQRAADARNGFEARTGTTQPGFDITPAMRERAAGGLPLFHHGSSTTRGMPVESLRLLVNSITAHWKPEYVNVKAVATATDLPADIQASLRSMRAMDTTHGLMMPDGRVFLVADHLADFEEAQRVLFHEVYGHKGMRAFLGDSYDSHMALLRMANPKLSAEADEWFRQFGKGQIDSRVSTGMTPDAALRTVRALAIEEALADRAGDAPAPKGWKLLMARLIKALRSINWIATANWLEKKTEAETHALLINSRRTVERGQIHAYTGGPVLSRVVREEGIPRDAVEIHSARDTDALKAHQDYKSAKAGNLEAAARLVRDLVAQDSIDAAVQKVGSGAIWVFPHAEEATGHNAIPAMMAAKYAAETGGQVGQAIVQSNRAFHTGADAMQRLIARPIFDGPVVPGARYAIVDDVTTMGGTLAELADHIRSGGGKVVGVVTLANSGRSPTLAPLRNQTQTIQQRYGQALRDTFSINPAALTRDESSYVLGFRDADSLRARAAAAERQRSDRLRAKGLSAENQELSHGGDLPLLSQRTYTPEETEALRKAGIGGAPTARQKIRAAWDSTVQLMRDRNEVGAWARQATLDQFHGIKRTTVRELGNLPVEQDPYITARLANGGTSSVMRALMLHGQARWAANGQHLEKIPGTTGLLDVLKPLGSDINDFFGWMIGNRAARLMSEGRENNFTQDDIAALQGLANTPEKLAAFRTASMQYAAFKRSVLDIAQAAGLINPETRRAWDYADYIPFYRQIDERSVFSPTGKKGLAGQSSGIRTLKGGDSSLNDPMENLLMNFSRLIDASLKNNAIRKTIDALGQTTAVNKVGYDMQRAYVPADQVARHLLDAGTPAPLLDVIPPEAFEGMAQMWSIKPPADEDVVRVMSGGKPQFYRINDPMLLKSLTSFVPFDFPGLGLMRAAKRMLTATVTATPDFMIRNWIRDSIASQAITPESFNPLKSVQGIVKSYREQGGFEDLLFAGASFQAGNMNAADPKGTAVAMRRALRTRGMSALSADAFMSTVIDTPTRLWERYREIGEAVENANREAVFEATRNAGGSVTEAAYEAKDLMDFTLRGSSAAYQILADVLPFFNARMQGMYRMGRSDPKRLMQVGTLLMVASLMLAMANDGEDWYEELPDWDKDTFWHFKVGGQHWRIPKPFEIGVVFATIPERIGRSFKGLDTGKKTLSRLWSNVRDQLAVDPVPQLIRPAVNVWGNKDTFRDTPIEGMADEGKTAPYRYSARTSPTMRHLSQDILDPLSKPLQAVDAAAPAFGLSPKRLEYLMNGYFGTAGMYSMALADILVRSAEGAAPGPAARWDDLPIVRSFYREEPARATVFESDLYKMRAEVDALFKDVTAQAKDGHMREVRKLLVENADKFKARSLVTGGAKTMSELDKMRDQIIADRTMTPDQKRQRIDVLQAKKNVIAKQVMSNPAVKAAQ